MTSSNLPSHITNHKLPAAAGSPPRPVYLSDGLLGLITKEMKSLCKRNPMVPHPTLHKQRYCNSFTMAMSIFCKNIYVPR